MTNPSKVAHLYVRGSDRPAVVDADLAHLACYRWKLAPTGDVIREADEVLRLAREVVVAERGMGVVHRSGDKLDNRRENLLYPCTAAEARAHQVRLSSATRLAESRESKSSIESHERQQPQNHIEREHEQ